MNMVMNKPARRAPAFNRTRVSGTTTGNAGATRSVPGKPGELNLRGRLGSSPEVYTGLQRQPYGE